LGFFAQRLEKEFILSGLGCEGLTLSPALKRLAGLRPFFTPATVLKHLEMTIAIDFQSEYEKYA
jgi:hypothetical protein